MNLYPKKLKGIDSLKREKAILLKLTEKNDFDFLENDGNLFDELDFFSNINKSKNDNINQQKTTDKNNEASEPDFLINTVQDFAKKQIFKLGKEVLGGYLKWKAVELSIKGIRHFMNKNNKATANKKSY